MLILAFLRDSNTEWGIVESLRDACFLKDVALCLDYRAGRIKAHLIAHERIISV